MNISWGGSSVGRALQSHCRGRGFDSLPLHFPFAVPDFPSSSDCRPIRLTRSGVTATIDRGPTGLRMSAVHLDDRSYSSPRHSSSRFKRLSSLGVVAGSGSGVVFAAGLVVGWSILERSTSSSAPADWSAVPSASSESCAKCHADHYESWHRTYHRTMTREATPEYVKGDFADAVYDYQGLPTRFTRSGDTFQMETIDPDWAAAPGQSSRQDGRCASARLHAVSGRSAGRIALDSGVSASAAQRPLHSLASPLPHRRKALDPHQRRVPRSGHRRLLADVARGIVERDLPVLPQHRPAEEPSSQSRADRWVRERGRGAGHLVRGLSRARRRTRRPEPESGPSVRPSIVRPARCEHREPAAAFGSAARRDLRSLPWRPGSKAGDVGRGHRPRSVHSRLRPRTVQSLLLVGIGTGPAEFAARRSLSRRRSRVQRTVDSGATAPR